MNRKAALVLILLLSVSTVFPTTPALPFFAGEPVSGPSLSDQEYEVFDLVNRERSRKRLRRLDWDDDLADLARQYSRKMARERFFDHYDRNGRSVMDRANESHIRGWERIGENLFYCAATDRFSSLAIRGWLESPTHRENMLDRGWTASGIGIAQARDGSIYITQVFIQ